ncbi:hypothetical protein K503DRAFT_785046 [Rhizopogon vinicolor AM-OR11-026]|uniref:Uncharacterized protein n=1 Tax=Rhizopogon vinicolor AM-OR11-026 TaxID=1314800 RepID=A0A1B7MSF5_9AGAM|nr:hypothetical protein K503DRAFT_785046 [Rhizopogon vinicolor AM-OR11-026]
MTLQPKRVFIIGLSAKYSSSKDMISAASGAASSSAHELIQSTSAYLKAFALSFIESGHIRLSHEVIGVEEIDSDGCMVRMKYWNKGGGTVLEETWDAVDITTMWFDNPFLSDIQARAHDSYIGIQINSSSHHIHIITRPSYPRHGLHNSLQHQNQHQRQEQDHRIPLGQAFHLQILYAQNPTRVFIDAIIPFFLANLMSTWLTLAWPETIPVFRTSEETLVYERKRLDALARQRTRPEFDRVLAKWDDAQDVRRWVMYAAKLDSLYVQDRRRFGREVKGCWGIEKASTSMRE